jgi:hypothetical protein
MTYKKIILISVFALSGVYLGIAARSEAMMNLLSSKPTNQTSKDVSTYATVPAYLIKQAGPLVEKMLLGGSDDKPQDYAKQIVGVLLKAIKSGKLSNDTKELLESIKGTLKRCSESNTVWVWSELRDKKFRSLLSPQLLVKIDNMNTM